MDDVTLPRIAAPWHDPFPTGSDLRVSVTHVTDPHCPWAYSFEPVMRIMEARYGDQLEVRTVVIGLIASVEQALERGSSPEKRALTAVRYRRFGMPITPHVRARVMASAPACRLVKAAALQGEAQATAVLRALRLAWYTTPLLLDEDDVLAEVCASVEGLDAGRAMAALHGDEVAEAYEADRAEARTASGIAVKLGRAARSDGPMRHTAPTLILTARDGRQAVVPGFQPWESVDVALMNLEPGLVRLPVPALEELVDAYPGGITSQEVARVLADTTATVDRQAAEVALTGLAAQGRIRRRALGDDALWAPV